jgi:hypothetical protein
MTPGAEWSMRPTTTYPFSHQDVIPFHQNGLSLLFCIAGNTVEAVGYVYSLYPSAAQLKTPDDGRRFCTLQQDKTWPKSVSRTCPENIGGDTAYGGQLPLHALKGFGRLRRRVVRSMWRLFDLKALSCCSCRPGGIVKCFYIRTPYEHIIQIGVR